MNIKCPFYSRDCHRSRTGGVLRIMMSIIAVFFMMPILAAQADGWPDKPITMIVGFGVGGSADRTARSIATFLPDELGQPAIVLNKKGAGSQLAASYVLSQPADGYTLFATAFSPYLATSIIVGGAKYDIDDFIYVNSQWTDWDIIVVPKDSPYKTLPDLMQAIKDNPKKIKASLIFGSSAHLTTLLLLEAFDIPQENLNMVSYDSGGASRSAVAGGQVDFTIAGGEGSEGIRDFVRPLAVVRETAAENWDAPSVNEALKPAGVKIPVVLGSMRGIAVPKEFKEKYPDRYEKLVSAYKNILSRDDVKKYLKRTQISDEWIGPEDTTRMVKSMYSVFETYKDLLKN